MTHTRLALTLTLLAALALTAACSGASANSDWQPYVPTAQLGQPLDKDSQEAMAESLGSSIAASTSFGESRQRVGKEGDLKIFLELKDPKKLVNEATLRKTLAKWWKEPVPSYTSLVTDMKAADLYVFAVFDHQKTASGGVVVVSRTFAVDKKGLIDGTSVSHPFVERSVPSGNIEADYEAILDGMSKYSLAFAAAAQERGEGAAVCFGNTPFWVDASVGGTYQAQAGNLSSTKNTIVATGAMEPGLVEGAAKFVAAHGETMATCQARIYTYLIRPADFTPSQSFLTAQEVSKDGKTWFEFEGSKAFGDVIAASTDPDGAEPEMTTEAFQRMGEAGHLAF